MLWNKNTRNICHYIWCYEYNNTYAMIITKVSHSFVIYDSMIITILSKSVMWCYDYYNTNAMIILILSKFVMIYDALIKILNTLPDGSTATLRKQN